MSPGPSWRVYYGQAARVARPHVVILGHSLWWGRLLILGSLLLLAVGLWLSPRAVADLRALIARVAPRLERWRREGNWGILLVPVTSFGLTIFGVRPWTIAALVAAIVVTIRWPRLAADLVPLVLVVFAAYGFMLVSRWVPGPRVLAAPQPTQFGAISVDSSQTSLLAGVEASALLAFGAWLFPRTIGAHARGKPTTGHEVELAGRVQRLTETRGHALDAAAAELRRIERDLHDGAQQRLATLAVQLRAAAGNPTSGPEELRDVLEQAANEVTAALNEVRNIARGIHPAVLSQGGLAPALQALARRSAVPVKLAVSTSGRPAEHIEVTAYYIVSELLTNTAKHAHASVVRVAVEQRDKTLYLSVRDDGVGGADLAQGSGLIGLRDRVEAIGGTAVIHSPAGAGTTVLVSMPLDWSV
jgi:signal transduction histidine kinase